MVTRRKEEESQSSSIYYQNDIWTPTIAFADFINNETLLGEVGSPRGRGEGFLCVWCLGCPTPGHGLEGMMYVQFSDARLKEFSNGQRGSSWVIPVGVRRALGH